MVSLEIASVLSCSTLCSRKRRTAIEAYVGNLPLSTDFEGRYEKSGMRVGWISHPARGNSSCDDSVSDTRSDVASQFRLPVIIFFELLNLRPKFTNLTTHFFDFSFLGLKAFFLRLQFSIDRFETVHFGFLLISHRPFLLSH